jgi:thiol:disulfide interchange protein/DsbC/DsbD-like thiol-disulfide interchange protein
VKKSRVIIFGYSLLLQLFLFNLALINPAMAQDRTAGQHVKIRLVPEKTTIRANETIWIGIEQTIDDNWHTYWVNAGDSGEPTRAEWALPQGFEISDISWPIPHKISMPPLTNYGYEGQVVLLQSLTAPPKLPEGPIELSVDIELLVCEEICIPEYSSHTLTFNNGENKDNIAYIDEASMKLPYDVPWHVRFSENNGNLRLITSPSDTAFLFESIDREKDMVFMPYEWGLIDNGADTDIDIDGDTITITHKRGDRPLSALKNLRGLVAYYDLQGVYSAFEFNALAGDTAAAANGGAVATDLAPNDNDTSHMTVFTALLFALFGGLILNLMPCVFPILSMKALSLCKMRGKELKHARAHGLLYTAGILVAFGVIAGALMVLKAGGAQIGWGFQLQNPSVVLFLSWLLFVIGLNLAGFFNLSLVLSDNGKAKEDTAIGSFFTGILATLVATPCTAPFMGVALGFAIIQPAFIGMLVFLMLGLGLALPYLLLSFFPRLRNVLPKPGLWMERFKEFLAFPMFLSAIWLVWVYTGQAGSLAMITALGGMVLITFGLWLVKIAPHDKGRKKLFIDALAFVVLVLVLTIFMIDMKSRRIDTAMAQQIEEASLIAPFTTEKYEELLATGAPIFVNMTADWCITCKVNEAVALNVTATKMIFATQKIHYLKGDWTNQNAEITTYLDKYGRNGVPLYVYYAPVDPSTGQRPQPHVLPQILTPGILKETLTP